MLKASGRKQLGIRRRSGGSSISPTAAGRLEDLLARTVAAAIFAEHSCCAVSETKLTAGDGHGGHGSQKSDDQQGDDTVNNRGRKR